MAAAISPVDLAALKSRHPLGDTVEAAGVELRGRGRVRQGVCPFHREGEGSFTVYADTERYWCFGCGEGGDVLDFVQRTEGVGLPEAIRRLEAGGGCSSRSAETQSPRRPTAGPVSDPAALTVAARYYAGQLRCSPQAQRYLAARGVGAGAAARLGLGYAPGSGLRRHLEAADFGAERLSRSGLFTPAGERFAGMIVVPDAAGGIARWMAGRAIDPGASHRFQALPGPKARARAWRGSARPPPWVVLTEGLFDWVALAGWGLPASAALGTQGAERIAASLRGCGRVFLAFDADDAGREATERLHGLLGTRAASHRPSGWHIGRRRTRGPPHRQGSLHAGAQSSRPRRKVAALPHPTGPGRPISGR